MKGNRELPHIVGQLTILPKHYWEGQVEASGEPRDISQDDDTNRRLAPDRTRIKSLEDGHATIVYEHVKDYWAKDLPVERGQ